MLARLPEVQAAYEAYLAESDGSCSFCSLVEHKTDQVIEDTGHFLFVKNRFPYITWDGKQVLEHCMIVPSRHIVMLDELNEHEVHEFVKLITKYEKGGFSVYLRATSDPTRSVSHQHTHLIRLSTK